jgi:hypothetical protein
MLLCDHRRMWRVSAAPWPDTIWIAVMGALEEFGRDLRRCSLCVERRLFSRANASSTARALAATGRDRRAGTSGIGTSPSNAGIRHTRDASSRDDPEWSDTDPNLVHKNERGPAIGGALRG